LDIAPQHTSSGRPSICRLGTLLSG
jgi:hypothetical protein